MQQEDIQLMPHSFYIPVMGTGFTIDTPLFVAKYGISSVISLVDDVLIEQMRKFWCEKYDELYEPIDSNTEDARAKRITAYLNLLKKIVEKQIVEVKNAPFDHDSEITKYFEMLPSDHKLKKLYDEMVQEVNPEKKFELQRNLREQVVPGRIDVNIMTKLDKENYFDGKPMAYEFCDAAAALRGYANSNLCSTIEFSAGFNPKLYGYISQFADFFPDENNQIKKKVCLKVSDYRSATVQGKYLAKRGIWVSEYRVESSLNCGGHAFINDGQLLGQILEEFKQYKNELSKTLHELYQKALASLKKFCSTIPQKVKITAQGGVGTSVEHEFLLKKYALDGIGWGTPFLLVPEATNVDDETLSKLVAATKQDVFLSGSSPLGIPFWNLKNSPSEEGRLARIQASDPGSFCVKGYLKFNREFTAEPICQAAKKYQTLKLKELENSDLPQEKLNILKEGVLQKSCICHELGGGVLHRRGVDYKIKPAICPGPNIINFKKIATLKEMVSHIYGHLSLLVDKKRPHVFVKELQLQIDHLLQEVKNNSIGLPVRSKQKLAEVKENLLAGIEYYRGIASEILSDNILESLQELSRAIDDISFVEVRA